VRAFEYDRAIDVPSAVAALTDHPDSNLLAGGTNLVDLMKLGVERPGHLVDISRVDFGGVEVLSDGTVRIGASVRNSELAADPIIRERYPMLSKALLSAASGQLRNLATTAGNLLQRTRCVYFMDVSKPCNKREPGSGCPAHEGVSRELAILGGSDSCIATHPGDMAVALTALDATIHYQTVNGSNSVPIGEFYRLPEDRPELDTTLPAGAVITAVDLPPLSFGATSTYRKARDRRSYAFALGSVAAAIDIDDGMIRDVRIGLGAVSHKPWRASIAENLLRGQLASADNFTRAAEAELAQANPTEQNAFKVPLLQRLIVGTLWELVES
jgi:xanthine dehydrogenase YagS FAD-binding subunit